MTSTLIRLDSVAFRAFCTEFADVADATLREVLAAEAHRAHTTSNLPWDDCVKTIRATRLGEGQIQHNDRPSLWTDSDERQYRLNSGGGDPTFIDLPECFAGLQADRKKFCYVPSQHFEGALQNDCLRNAFDAANKQGGRVCVGYMILEYPHHYDVAPHVVWEKVNGTLVDPTPHGIDKVAFLPKRTIAPRDGKAINNYWRVFGGLRQIVWKT